MAIDRTDFEQAITHFKKELTTVRTGRANPAIVESIQAEAYGTLTPLNQLASISLPDARTLVIAPWDKSVLGAIEKAILVANIGINPVNDGEVIRLNMPTMTEETRKEVAKQVAAKAEQVRIHIRQIRDDIKQTIIQQEKDKELSEDQKFNILEDLDKTTGSYNDTIKEIAETKTLEIMSL